MNFSFIFRTAFLTKTVFALFVLSFSACHRSGPIYSTVKSTQKVNREITVKTSSRAVYGKKDASVQMSHNPVKSQPTQKKTTSHLPQEPTRQQNQAKTPKKQPEPDKSFDYSATEVLQMEQRSILAKAFSMKGTPHKIGGMGHHGIDCSGLMVLCFREIGLELPRTSREQAELGKDVSRNELKLCDLVFFSTTGSNRITHVGMVSKVNNPNDIMFIHASTSRGVIEESLFGNTWQQSFVKAKRIL